MTASNEMQPLSIAKPSNWHCYMFGNRPGGSGIVYRPSEGCVPNRFVRWMMRLCFDCVWRYEERRPTFTIQSLKEGD